MPLVTFYFQLHQPFRLNPEVEKFFLWEEKNREIFQKVAQKNYLPATRMFTDLVRTNPHFKICMSFSGVFLEQAELYQPEVIHALDQLYHAGKDNNQVEFLEETYYHSLASLFHDPFKQEFKDQVSLHRHKIRELFDFRPTAFRNTELMYNNEIANVVADMGYKAILCEQRDDMYNPQDGKPISPNAVFKAKGRRSRNRDLIVIPRNRHLSDDVAFRFKTRGLHPQDYARYIAEIDGEAVLLGYDYEHIGEHLWSDTGIFEFWQVLAAVLEKESSIVMANPTEIAERFKDTSCPVVDIHPLATSSWADMERNTFGWLGSDTQYTLFRDIEQMENEARQAGGMLLTRWRHLTTSDHLYYLHEGKGADRTVHDYFSPYNSLTKASYVLTRNIDLLRSTVKRFNVKKQTPVTPIVIITPETAKLPSEGMGRIAHYISGKSGGLGEVIAALCKGLAERKVSVHLVTLNLKRRFLEESHLSESEWIQSRHKLNPENIHLVTSGIFENQRSAYEGDPARSAAEFQSQIINTYLKDIRSQYEGRAILHSHDWMAGGALTAYAKVRQIPILHTVHNTHTCNLPFGYFPSVNLGKFRDNLYTNWDNGCENIDAHATAIKNATLVSYVGETFLQEITRDYFLDRPIIPGSVRQETKVKSHSGAAIAIPNGISSDMYPENQNFSPDFDKPGLAKTFSPDHEILPAKKINLAKLQKQMGLKHNPDAILLFWPSRLDPSQKGVELLEDIALKFVIEHHDVQIAIIGDPVGADRSHAEILGRIACASDGKIGYRSFNQDLCMLGYAAASDVFGASLYEPFGQIDVLGNLYGATATNRQTGGYADKIVPLSLRVWGGPQDSGNGVLFKTYDSGGLWWGLHQTVENHRYFRNNPHEWERQAKRIMLEARKKWSLENMIAGYITAYEKLNAGNPLA